MAKIETAEPTEVEAPDEFEALGDDLAIAAKNMNIGRYEPKRKPGKYDDQVATLIQVNDKTGYQNSTKILVPAEDAKKHKKWFSDSARAQHRSARIVNGDLGEPQGDGGVLMEFVLTDMVVRTATPKKTEAADSDSPAAA